MTEITITLSPMGLAFGAFVLGMIFTLLIAVAATLRIFK